MSTTKPVSTEVSERARKYHSLALQKISSVGQINIAEALSTSETTVSRCVNGDLERVCQLLAAAGLKVVPKELRCYQEADINALFILAKGSLERMESPDKLSFDD
jgi:hypothetical protein